MQGPDRSLRTDKATNSWTDSLLFFFAQDHNIRSLDGRQVFTQVPRGRQNVIEILGGYQDDIDIPRQLPVLEAIVQQMKAMRLGVG